MQNTIFFQKSSEPIHFTTSDTMWKVSINTVSSPFFFTTNIKASMQQLQNSKRYLYYYSNLYLNKSSTDFTSKTTSDNLLQFTPNYRILPSNSRLISSVTSTTTCPEEPSVIEQVAAKTLACHPPSSDSSSKKTSHIPFEVKAKQSVNKTDLSVIQRLLQGEKIKFKQIYDPYMALTKPHLTFLIMLSSICSYALAPNALNIQTFLNLTVGILLTSGSANAINMGREPHLDSKMVRTSARPIVRGLVTPNEAYAFALATGSLGCAILYCGVNPTVAVLGATNIVLYSWIYTSLKRKSILNTWVGAIVGAIPPLMGWAACSSLSDPGAWCLAALLYAWQFPHFNSLSHNIKSEYQRAGYVMTAFVNPKLNARVALRYSLLMFPICLGLSFWGVCDNYFAFDSSILNGWMAYMSFRFWLQQKHNYSKKVIANGGPTTSEITTANVYAKKLFWCSIWQLPVVLVLAMLHKTGQWDGIYYHFFGNNNDTSNFQKLNV